MEQQTIILLTGIVIAAIACQWFAWFVKLPAVLFLLIAGILAGPVTGILNPNAMFGGLLLPMVSLSVAVILFEGGLTLKLEEIRGLEKVVRNLVTIGVLVTWTITSLAARFLLDFPWELSFLFGAVTVVTGPTVIVPMLRTVRPNAKVANVLRWEGIVIDPIGALLAVLVFGFIVSESVSGAWGHTFVTFSKIVVTGLAAGAAAGYIHGTALRNHWLPEYLHNLATLAFVCGIFAASNTLAEESGLLAVTVFGMWLANMKGVPVDEILDFKESLSVLLISVLFIVLAARIEFSQFKELGMPAVWVLLTMQFLARPLKVHISTIGSALTWPERHLLAWIAPRGIVAAAISAVFALRLEQSGAVEKAHLLVPLTFMVIIWTVVFQSATSGTIARILGVAEPEPKGFLIIGANSVARTIAKAVVENGYRVLLADSSWDNISKARMEGLATYYGNPISEHADRNLDLVGIGRMLALSPLPNLNALANLRYRGEFGRDSIYTVLGQLEKDSSEKHVTAADLKGYTLFGGDVTYSKLAGLIAQGAEVRGTNITENFTMEEYKQKYSDNSVPLFAIDPKQRIEFFVKDGKMKPSAGWTAVSLVKEETPKIKTSEKV